MNEVPASTASSSDVFPGGSSSAAPAGMAPQAPQQQQQPLIQQQPQQQQQQQQMIQQPQQQQQQQQSASRDVVPLFNERVYCILEPGGDPKRKIKAFEEIRELFDELYLKEHAPIIAQAAVKIFLSVFSNVAVAYYDDQDAYQMRKASLDLVVRFVPLDQYKSSTKQFEELFYQAIPKENELNASFMIRYVVDFIRSQKVTQRFALIRLVNELRLMIENLNELISARPEVFSRPQFNNEYIDSDEYRIQFLNNLHFDIPIKPKRIHVYPRASNSIKVLTEFCSMSPLILMAFKDEVAEEISHLLRVYTALLNYNLPKVNVDPEYSALFQETQLKILNFIYMLVKPPPTSNNSSINVSNNLLHLVNPYRRDIAVGARKLIRNLEASAINYRKDVITTIKSILTTDLRMDFIDIIPDFCYEEIICGPPTIVTPQFRTDLFVTKADAFHSVRQYLDWLTFQHVTMIIIRDVMDFTLSPPLQGIYGKLVLNYIDACQKAETGNHNFTQLVLSYSYDSARFLFSNLFFALTHRLDVITQECTRKLLANGNKSALAPKINEYYDSDEEDSDAQSWMQESKGEVEIENIIEPMDEYERDEEPNPEDGHSFVSIAMESLAKAKTSLLEENMKEMLVNGEYEEKNPQRQSDAEEIERNFDKNVPLSKHAFKTKDSRTQMIWLNRPLKRNLEVLPLIKSHSEIPPEKCNTFLPPDNFPYSYQELRTIYKNYTGALRQLLIMAHFDDDLKSSNPPMEYYIALNKLFRNFVDVFELCNFTASQNPPFLIPHNQAATSVEDKDMCEFFITIFAHIHPALYERILKHHISYLIHRSTVSFAVQQLLLLLLQTTLSLPSSFVLFDYLYENMDIMFLYDDDDKHRVDFFGKLIRLVLTSLMSNLRTEPLLKDYVEKIQMFFYKFITKTVYYVLRMHDASHLQGMLKSVLRLCGSPQAENFYRLFLPLFPSFLHLFSALQNVLQPDSLQDYFIELCLSLPARLSSLVPYMSLLADPEINSFQNPTLLYQQGIRTIELCLQNYAAFQVRDFFGPQGIARLLENLWNFVSTAADHQISLQILKIIGKLASLNRNALCDVQKLSFSSTETKPDTPSVVLCFERSGRSTDAFVAKAISIAKVSKDFDKGISDIQESRKEVFNFEQHQIETKPLNCNLLLRPVLSHCCNILKNSLFNERNFSNLNRPDSAWILLTWIRSGFDSYGMEINKEQFVHRFLIINKESLEKSKVALNRFNVSFESAIPYKSEIPSARQMFIDCIAGLSYAVANDDLKADIEAHWEELVDFLTIQLHVETSIQYFGGNLFSFLAFPCPMDSYVIVDAVISILCEANSRFHACAIFTLLRMIQTCLSFAPTPEEALNIPIFHFLVKEAAQLCLHPESCHRIGGIYLLEIITETLPSNFLFAVFNTIFTAALDVCHCGDDDVSLTSQECAVNVGKKLMDKVFGLNSKDLFHYLADLVLKHLHSSSFWTNKLLCEILGYLQSQNIVSPTILFPMEKVHQFYKQHEIEFLSSKLEFRYVQLNLLVKLLNCSRHLLPFTSHTSNYLQTLASLYVYSDDVIANSPNYELVPPHPPTGTNLVPTSPLLKPSGSLYFLDRLKQFRGVLAESTAALCLNFYQSRNLTSINFSSNFEICDINNGEEAAKFLLRLHCTNVMKRTDRRFELSIAVLTELESHMTFGNKSAFVTEIVGMLTSDSSRIHLYKALDAIVKQKNDMLHRQITSLIFNNIPQYLSLCQTLTKIITPNEKMVECLLAFLSVVRKLEYQDDKLFDDLFAMLSSKRTLSLFELGEVDLFSPVVIFLGSNSDYAAKACNFFLSPVNIKEELKRRAFLTLICHPDGCQFLTFLKHCEKMLIDLIKLRSVKAGTFERAAELEPIILDEFVFKILTQFASTFPNWLARNKKLAEFLRQFLLSDYFRGNYLMQDFCMGKNDRLRLTSFKISLAIVPDLLANLLMNYFVYNPRKYEILLALCSLLPQMTFYDNGALKKFIKNYVVNRTTLLWRRNLLKFTMSKFVTVFNNFPKAGDPENFINQHNDCQLYLGNFFLYVVYPCFDYVCARFRAHQVFNCEFDQIIGKRRWKKHSFRASVKASHDLVDLFCEKVLTRFQHHFQDGSYRPPLTIRPELSHGILQMAILLLQRASSHIHTPGSKKQSRHLQTMMQTAWGSLTQTGIYVDRWLRSVAYFLLSNVMNAFYIKRDIVYQLFDCLILLPDMRENPIAQKALDGIATHSARRRDECYQGLVDKIKEALVVDGFNLTKIGNVLFMLANNFEAFLPARGALLPSVVFVLIRVQNTRQANVLNFIYDGLETIIGWEDLRYKKFNLVRDQMQRTQTSDPNRQLRTQSNIQTLARNSNFIPTDRSLADTVSLLICRIMAQTTDFDRSKRFVSIFHKAIQPRIFCRVICQRLEKMLTIREPFQQGSPQFNSQLHTVVTTTKILTNFFMSASPEAVHQCMLYLEKAFAGSIRTQNITFIETSVNLIAKCMEITKGLPTTTDKKNIFMYQTLTQYFNYIGDSFILKSEWNDIQFMISVWKTICMSNDFALNLFAGPHFIKVASHMARTYRVLTQTLSQLAQNDFAAAEKRQFEMLTAVLELYIEKSSVISVETMALYLAHVISTLVKTNETMSSKILELICKTLEVSLKPPHSIKQTHHSIIGHLTRYHTAAIMKSSVATASFFSSISTFCKVKWEEDSAEIQIPFYLGLTANLPNSPIDAKIRSSLLDIYDSRLPKSLFERLSHLLMIESWQLVNIAGILPLMVEMLLRCVKDIAYDHEQPLPPPPMIPEFEDAPMTEAATVVEVPVSINPAVTFWSSIRTASIGEKSLSQVTEIPDPLPCPQGIFTQTSVEFLPKRLKNICEDYFGAIERSSDLFTKKFPEFMCAYLHVVYQEPDLAGKIFVELFSSIWASLSDFEREFIQEIYAQFLQLPIFNGASEKTSKYFWLAIQKCNPPMMIDKTKILSTLTGLKNVHSAAYSLEKSLPRTINLLEAVSDLRQIYRILNEDDMVAETWRIYGYSAHALSANILYNQSKFGEALEEVQKAQNDLMQLIKIGDQPVDFVNVSIKNDYDFITNLGISCLKQLGKWDEVYKHANKLSNAKLASEALFHLLKEDENQWIEFDNLSRSFSSSEDISDAFLCLFNHIVFCAHEDGPKYQQIFVEGGSLDRLGSILGEKWRRLPSFYSPKYQELLSELSLFVDVMDGTNFVKEMNTLVHSGAVDRQEFGRKFQAFMDTILKKAVVDWHHRTISPSDSLECATKIYKTRIVFLNVCNNELKRCLPEWKDIRHPSFTLTPMHSILQFGLKQCEHFCRYSLFSEAKNIISALPIHENLNVLDGCLSVCSLVKASLKQFQYQRNAISYTLLRTEFETFMEADIKQFTPDTVAFYAATRAEIFACLEKTQCAEESFRASLKISSMIDDISQAQLSKKCYKVYSNYAYDRYLETREPAKGLAAVAGLLKYISKEHNAKADRHILRLIYIVKRLSVSPVVPDLIPIFYALAPKCKLIMFLPYLHLIASEVTTNANQAFATLMILIAQAFPQQVLHAIYLQIGSQKFMKHISNLQQSRTVMDEDVRIASNFHGVDNIVELHEYVYFNNFPDYSSLPKMEAANRNGYPFKLWLSRKELKTSSTIFASMIYIINKYVPVDVSAFCQIINGIEKMNGHFVEKYYQGWITIWDLTKEIVRTDEKELIETVMKLHDAMRKELNNFLKNTKFDGPKRDLLNRLRDEFPKLEKPFNSKLSAIAHYIASMENVIEKVYSTIRLEELSQELYNFTGKLGRVISFSSMLDVHSPHCIPFIDSFVPNVKIFAKNGTFIKQLDVRISNGKMISYYIEPSSIEEYLASATNSFSSLNISAEKFPDSNRRGALFRIPVILQLDGIRLFEVAHHNVNRNSTPVLATRPLSFIMAEASQCHPYKAIAEYYSNLSSTMSIENSTELIEALKKQEKEVPENCLFNWLIKRYEEDLGCVWYIRKSMATQMALFSLVQYVFDLDSMKLENMYFDMSYGKIWNVTQSFSSTSQSHKAPFRLSPAFVEFYGLSLNGHFIPTMVALAQAFIRKRFEDYFRPYYWDFLQQKLKKEGKKITASEINDFDTKMNIFKQRLNEIANYNGDASNSAIFKLCNDSQSIEKRSLLSPDLYPWF